MTQYYLVSVDDVTVKMAELEKVRQYMSMNGTGAREFRGEVAGALKAWAEITRKEKIEKDDKKN